MGRVSRLLRWSGRALPLLGLLGNPHTWLLLGMLALGGALHYTNPFAALDAEHRIPTHSMLRILFLLPVVYGAFVFGLRGGMAVLVMAVLLMTPQALRSSAPLDDMMEVSGIALVGLLTMAWFEAQQKGKERRQEAVRRLESARRELASHVETIKANERRLRAIQEVCSLLTQAPELGPTLQQVLNRVVEVVGVDAGLVFLMDAAGEELTLAAHQGVSEAFARAVASLRVGEGFNGRVARDGRPLIVEDAASDPRLTRSSVRDEGIRSELIVPLSYKSQAIGTLCLAVRSCRTFAPEEVNLVTAIGEQLGITIENARLYLQVRASEEKYRDLFENATLAIWVHDLAGTITDANKACASLTGYAASELVGSRSQSLFSPPAATLLAGIEQALFREERASEPYEVSLLRKDGKEIKVSVSTRLICEKGQPVGFQHIARDITEAKRMRENLDYYMRRTLSAQEEERKRIARELHDETAQALLLISRRLDALASDPENSISGEIRADLESLRGVVIDTLTDLRHLTEDLRPRILDELGLVAALEWMADELRNRGELSASVVVLGHPQPMRPEAQLLLFRIAQEALSNIRRHAAATEVRITLEQAQDRVRLSVRDDGRGFQVPVKVSDLAAEGKLGLLGMYERARLLSGTLSVHSEPGKGTTVVAEVPA